MNDKPELGGTSAKPGRGKAKAAPAIDLSASEIREIQPETTAGPETIPPADAAADAKAEPAPAPEAAPATEMDPAPAAAREEKSPSKLAPALLGLVAGVIGGFAAGQFGPLLRSPAPAPEAGLATRLGALEQRVAQPPSPAPEGLAERISKAESRLAEAGNRETALRDEVTKLTAALAAERGARETALVRLGEQVAAGAGVAPANPPIEIEGLKSRLGAVENASKAAVGVGTRVESVAKELEAVNSRIASFAQRDAMGAANARIAAVNLLEDAFQRGRPLGGPLDLLKNLGAEAAALAAFAPFAASGVPGATQLLADLPAPAAAPAAAQTEPKPGLLDRVKQMAGSLVEIRKAGETSGSDDAAQLVRARQSLQRGDVPGALAAVSRLSPTQAPTFAAWRGKAEARVKAAEALVALRNEAFAQLARAASAK